VTHECDGESQARVNGHEETSRTRREFLPSSSRPTMRANWIPRESKMRRICKENRRQSGARMVFFGLAVQGFDRLDFHYKIQIIGETFRVIVSPIISHSFIYPSRFLRYRSTSPQRGQGLFDFSDFGFAARVFIERTI